MLRHAGQEAVGVEEYPRDYYRVVQKISGEQAFGKLAGSTCALVKKWR